MKKIQKARMLKNSIIYVKSTDYSTEINKDGYVDIKFKPELIDYYGTDKFTVYLKYNKEDLSRLVIKNRIREIIRISFKDHIKSYLDKISQEKLIDNLTFNEGDKIWE